MQHMIKEAPAVAQGFFDLTKAIRSQSVLGDKLNELVLIGIFVCAPQGLRGLSTHVERALTAGATKEEILSAILLALPVIGVTSTNLALERALETIAAKASTADVASAAR